MWDTKDTRGPQRRLKRGTATGDIKRTASHKQVWMPGMDQKKDDLNKNDKKEFQAKLDGSRYTKRPVEQ